MIFATVGTQLPFPRFVKALDAIAKEGAEDIIVQCGPCTQNAEHLSRRPHLTPAAFADHFKRARLVVAHAGIGTILSAKRYAKPLIIYPRRYDLGEHRNDHQLATAEQLQKLEGLYVAWTDDDLVELLSRDDLAPMSDTPSPSATRLAARLNQAILAP